MPMIIDGTNGGFFPSWTTATRPTSPVAGQMGYNTTTGNFDCYTANGWVTLLPSASGSTTQLASSSMPTGSVLQVLQNTTSTPTSTASTVFVTTGFSLSITPKFTTSKILITVNGGSIYASITGASAMYSTIYRGATNLGNATYGLERFSTPGGEYSLAPHSMSILDSPATTASTTYTCYFKNGGSAATVDFSSTDRGVVAMTIMEIAG
jgi:hypothetical protein